MIERIGIWILFTCIQRITAGTSIAGMCTDTKSYDVTKKALFVDSHDNYGTKKYPANTVQCMDIYTKAPNHVVKLKKIKFDVEGSDDKHNCSADNLRIYDNSIQLAGHRDLLGEYCDRVPKQIKSSSQSLFLYFKSNKGGRRKGFRFKASSFGNPMTDKPQTLSDGDITGISCGIGVPTIVCIFVCIWKYINREKNKNRENGKTQSKEQGFCCTCCVGNNMQN